MSFRKISFSFFSSSPLLSSLPLFSAFFTFLFFSIPDDGAADLATKAMMETLLTSSQSDGDCPNPPLCFALKSYIHGNIIAKQYLKSLVLQNTNVESTTEIEKLKNSEKTQHLIESEEEKSWKMELLKSEPISNKIVLKSLYGSRRRSVLLIMKSNAKQNTRAIITARTIEVSGTHLAI